MSERKKWTLTDENGLVRCWWCGSDALYQAYHDTEWGHPVVDDNRLFEKIALEGFQAGLSWITILRKRENFRAAFHDFDIATVAKFTERDVRRLLGDAGIVRHRGKIEAAITNAGRTLDIVDAHGSLASFVWRFAPRRLRIHRSGRTIPAETRESRALSRELRACGFRFVGPMTMYAFMQSVGMVNDHLAGCHAHSTVSRARSAHAPLDS